MSSVIALMMLAQPVSAATITSIVQDPAGDLGFGVDPKTGGIMHTWQDNTRVAEAKYLDIVSASFSQKGKTYTFGIEVAAALPEEGTPLPNGIHTVEWALWIDPSPYNVFSNPCPTLFLVTLRYDGSSYSAFMLDYETMLRTPVAFSHDGSVVQLQFTAASIGNLSSFWWSPLVRIWEGLVGTSGYWFVDSVSYEGADGYDYIDYPWPPV